MALQHPDPLLARFIEIHRIHKEGGEPDMLEWVSLARDAALFTFGGDAVERSGLDADWAGKVARSRDIIDLAKPIAAYEYAKYLLPGKSPAAWSGPTPWRDLAGVVKH